MLLTRAQARDLAALRTLWHSLGSGSVRLGLRQKGVDMRIGIDIASLTRPEGENLKRQGDVD